MLPEAAAREIFATPETLLCGVFAAQTFSGIPVSTIARRLFLFLPPMALIASQIFFCRCTLGL